MIRTKGRRRLTCHHEGGHALVRWYFGHTTDKAVVLTVEEVRAGKQVENRRGVLGACEGAVDGYDIHSWPFGPRELSGATPAEAEAFQRDLEMSRDIELINCAAGMAAEAHYRRNSVLACAIGGGDGDLQHTRDILDAWYPDRAERSTVALTAERRASALVRSPQGSAAIRAMADALMDRGEIKGDEIAFLCSQAYGGRACRFGGWAEHWPPTLAQLRAGFIPESEILAA